MVDVESMGRKPGCAILSIGLVRFDPTANLTADPQGRLASTPLHLQGKNQFYLAINNLDSSNRGFSADPDTMRWWKKQAIWPELSMAIMSSDTTVPQAAKKLTEFLQQSHSGGGVRLWANSPSFDIDILRSLYKVVDQEFPVDYRQEMDYRTIMELAHPHRHNRPARPEALAHLPMHHALGDAATQAHHLISASSILGIDCAQRGGESHVNPRSSTAPVLRDSEVGHDAHDAHGAHGASGRHLMIEVKTLGKKPGSSILSIGAVLFDPTGRRRLDLEPDNHFHVVLSSFDMGNYGFGSDPETVRWWKSQPIWPQLFKETVQSGVPLIRALKMLAEFIDRKAPDKVWANSPTFDIALLRDAHTAVRQDFAVTYRQEMDFRTITDLVHPRREDRPSTMADGFLEHHALGDAIGQSRSLVATLNRLTLDRDALACPQQPEAPRPGEVAHDTPQSQRNRRKVRPG